MVRRDEDDGVAARTGCRRRTGETYLCGAGTMDIAGRGTGPPWRSSADRDLRRTAGLAGIDPRLGGTGGHAGAGPQPGARLPARSVRRGRWHGGRPGRRAGTADRGQLLEEVVARHGDPAEE